MRCGSLALSTQLCTCHRRAHCGYLHITITQSWLLLHRQPGGRCVSSTKCSTRVVATVASPASGYPLLPTMARGLQPLDNLTSAACHVRARGAGDVPDGNDALWRFQEFLEPNATTMGTTVLRKRKKFMCPSLYRGSRKASDRRRLVIERMGGGFHWRHHLCERPKQTQK